MENDPPSPRIGSSRTLCSPALTFLISLLLYGSEQQQVWPPLRLIPSCQHPLVWDL